MPGKTKTTPRTQTQVAPADGEAPAPLTIAEEPRKRAKKPKEEEPDAEIDQELLEHPARMNYLLLLALLRKHDGRIELTPVEADINDEDYNVAFAKSLDGKRIVVSIVSVQSGILKTPQKETLWEARQQRFPEDNIRPFRPMPPARELGERLESTSHDLMTAAVTEQTPQEKYLQENDPMRKMPAMPFVVGDRPEDAGPMDLGAFTRTDQISSRVADEERAAAARVEAEQ